MTDGPQDGPLPAMVTVQDEIVEEMAGIGDWLGKYEYLVRIGRELSVPAEEIRKEEHAVRGCQSRLWIKAEPRGERLSILADSDTAITRGIIALLLRVLDGRTPSEVLSADLYFLDRTGLREHLSPARANGLGAMVKVIRDLAREVGGPS